MLTGSAKMQLETYEVTCPTCGKSSSIPAPEAGEELKIRGYAAPFDDPTKIECSAGHTFWVYYC